MAERTYLYAEHLALNARLVDFGGWDMPVQYTSVLDEHHAVRRAAGMFDVSHMTLLELSGPDALRFLQHVLANDVARLKTPGKALYSVMLNPEGGVIDDLIIYAPCLEQPDIWRIIVNCGTHDKDLAWLQAQAASFRVSLSERQDQAMLAIQGPHAIALVSSLLGGLFSPTIAAKVQDLPIFHGIIASKSTSNRVTDWFVSRTGYTGEDGVEIMLPNEAAPSFWRQLLAAGVMPCGLGARDTLRLEAGMPLYGNDMSEAVSPLVSNLAWSIAWEHDFIGKAALQAELAAGLRQKLVGLVLEAKGVLRAHMRVVVEGVGEGETTSGTFSPSLAQAIAFARIPVVPGLPLPERVLVEIRGKLVAARVVKPSFVRHGKALV